MIFIATLNARIEIFDSLTPDSGLFKAKFSSGAEKLALYSVSDDIKLIDMNYLYEVGTLVNNKQIFDVDLSENGHVLLACEYTTESVTDCRYYQEDKNEPVMEFRLLEKITHPKVSYDGRYFLYISNGNLLKILDMAETVDASSIEVSAPITSYDFSDDLHWVLIGTIDGFYHLWDTHLGMAVLEEDFNESIHKVIVGKQYALLTGRFKDDLILNFQSLSVTPLPNNKNLSKRLPSQVVSAAFHPSLDNIVAIARPADIVELWDHSTQKILKVVKVPMLKKDKFKRSTPLALQWDSQGHLVGVTSQGEVFKINFEGVI